MTEKSDVQVFINGKQYTLCGYESSEYLQRIANHLNEKYKEFKKQEGYNRLDMDMRSVLMDINLADDYFKAQRIADEMKQQQIDLEQELFDVKRELVQKKEEVDTLQKQVQEQKQAREAAEKQIIRLETELEQKNQQLKQGQAVSYHRPVPNVPTSVRTGQPVLTQMAKPGAPLAQASMQAVRQQMSEQAAMQGKPIQPAQPATTGASVQDKPAPVAGQTVPLPEAVARPVAGNADAVIMNGIMPAPKEASGQKTIPGFDINPVSTGESISTGSGQADKPLSLSKETHKSSKRGRHKK